MQTDQTTTPRQIELTRVKNDRNGNGRFVVHFLDLLTPEERATAHEQGRMPWLFQLAQARARSIGGSRWRGRDFKDGLVFQECGEELLRQYILNLLKGGKA